MLRLVNGSRNRALGLGLVLNGDIEELVDFEDRGNNIGFETRQKDVRGEEDSRPPLVVLAVNVDSVVIVEGQEGLNVLDGLYHLTEGNVRKVLVSQVVNDLFPIRVALPPIQQFCQYHLVV